MTKTAPEPRPTGLLPRVTCPHCWEQFAPQKLLWVSEHTDLLGDHRLGPEQAQRFLPTRFTVNGEALDAKGFPCHQLACPNCHLTIPRSLLELEPLFLSIFGAPASGKSYFLAALTWELRKTLPLVFRVGFADADPVLNQQLNEYEESVFSGTATDELVPLGNLIRKTGGNQRGGTVCNQLAVFGSLTFLPSHLSSLSEFDSMRQVLLTHATHPLLDEEKREGGRQRGRGWHKESGRFVR